MLREINTAYVLASASPRRKELLSYLQLEHVYQYAIETDETIAKAWTSDEAVMRLSVNKAFAVFNQLKSMPEQLSDDKITKLSIIAADTIVVRDEQTLGKPKDEQDAFDMLKSLQGRSHEVYTGLTLLTTTHKDVIAKDGLDERQVVQMISDIQASFHTNDYEQFGRIGKYKRLLLQGNTNSIVLIGYTRSLVTFRPLTDEQIWSYIKTGDPLDKAGSYGIQGIGAVNIESIDGDFYSVMGLPLGMLNLFITE